MSLVIDSNIDYFVKRLGISYTTFQEKYSQMTVDEMIQAEAAQGNQTAIALANELLNNTSLLIEIFELSNTNNKYNILYELTEQQLQLFLPQMEKNDMLQGLNFFSNDKLMTLLEELPKDQLVKTVFEMFSQEEIVELMPNDQLDKFLTSTEIDKNKILKHMQSIPEEYLAQVLEQIKGEAVDDKMNSYDLVKEFSQLKQNDYKDAITAFQPIQKQQLVLSLAKEHNEWFQLFDSHAYTNIIDQQKQKPEVIKGMSVIEPEHIQKMIEELPNDLLSVVITQIDTDKFAEILMDRMPDVIGRLILA